MALKILLADDSMTAQNMGKKILTEAGYEVVAVSNGAQAVKKIASEKPDLAVLDVFMPGYTGVEVCERLKKAQETVRMPVLLTVGKMEPFKPEEGTRVGADGLVVKPFEASDLLAAIKKLEEKLAPAAAEAPVEATIKLPVEEFQDASYEEWKVSAPETPVEEAAPAPGAVAVPDEMAGAPAFAMESLEEAPAPPAPSVADTQPIEPPPVARTTEPITPPDLRPTEPIAPPPEVFAEAPARTTAEMPAPLQAAAGAAAAPVLAEEAPAIEFTSQRIEHEVEPAPAPGFEPTVSQEQISAPLGRDPGLVTDTDELSHFATKFGVEGAEPIPVGVAAEMPGLYADSQAPAAEAPAAAEVSADADFEARVAAAMAGYAEPPTAAVKAPVQAPEPPAAVASPPPAPAPVEVMPEPLSAVEPEPELGAEHVGVGMETAAFIAQMQKAVEDLPVDTTPHVEAAAEPVPVPPPAPAPAPAPENVPDHALAAAMAAAVGAAVEPQVVAAAAPSPESTQKIDPTLIADIVSRVVERMKPDLAAEIARELESKLNR